MIDKPLRISRCVLAVIAMTSCFGTSVLADAPIFTSGSYSFSAYQGQESPYVGQVQAYDPEDDDFAYVLHDPSGLFDISFYHGYIVADLENLELGTYTMVVEAVDIYSESSYVDVEVVVVAAPPEITSFSVYSYGGGMYMISGVVDSSTPTGTVKFGGLMQGRSVPYGSNGQFTMYAMFSGSGVVTAWAVDTNGQESAVVSRFVMSY